MYEDIDWLNIAYLLHDLGVKVMDLEFCVKVLH